METFTEVLKGDPKHAYDFVSSNYNDMLKKSLLLLLKNCYTEFNVIAIQRKWKDC